MVYIVKGPFVNVPDPDAPPAGARHIDAEYLNGVEDYLAVGLPSELDATYATKMEVTEDPARPGIYTIGA